MEELDQAIKEAGGLTVVAAAMGITPQRLCNWSDRRAVPLEQCYALEEALGGRLKRWHLRPDDWDRIWPELVGTDGAPQAPNAPARAAA